MSTVRVGGALLAVALLSCHDGSSSSSSPCAPFDGRTEIGGDGVAEGMAAYDKRVITAQGSTGAVVETPIGSADVELVSCRTGAVLASGSTDVNGNFQIPFNNPGRVGVYVRVLSSSSRYAVSVKRSAAEPFLYGLASSGYDDTGNGETITVTGLTASAPPRRRRVQHSRSGRAWRTNRRSAYGCRARVAARVVLVPGQSKRDELCPLDQSHLGARNERRSRRV